MTIQAEILKLLREIQRTHGLAVLFISHDLAVVSQLAHKVAVMYAGSLVEMGSVADIFNRSVHPYTQGLLQAMPSLKSDRDRPLPTVEGAVPPLGATLPGCPFERRCPCRKAECVLALPELVEIEPGHMARCPVVAGTQHK